MDPSVGRTRIDIPTTPPATSAHAAFTSSSEVRLFFHRLELFTLALYEAPASSLQLSNPKPLNRCTILPMNRMRMRMRNGCLSIQVGDDCDYDSCGTEPPHERVNIQHLVPGASYTVLYCFVFLLFSSYGFLFCFYLFYYYYKAPSRINSSIWSNDASDSSHFLMKKVFDRKDPTTRPLSTRPRTRGQGKSLFFQTEACA